MLDRVSYRYWQHAEERTGAITKTTSARHFEVFDQYERLFAGMTPDQERFRPVLFRVMIDHYLVIVGNDRRLPDAAAQAVLPPDGAGLPPLAPGGADIRCRAGWPGSSTGWSGTTCTGPGRLCGRSTGCRSAQPRRAQHPPGQAAGPPGRAPAGRDGTTAAPAAAGL